MSPAGMMAGLAETSPRTKARITGVFFLLTVLLGGIGEGIAGRLVVAGDAATTADNILTRAPLLWLGFASYLAEMSCLIVVTVLFYDLLRPVSRTVSFLAACFGLVGIAIKTLSRLFYVAPLSVLGGAEYQAVFQPEQLQALAFLLIKVNARGAGMALAFLGVSTILKGYLVLKSTFWPRFLGVLGIVAGFGWLTFMAPPLANRVYPYIVTVGLLGAAAQILWLLVIGVDEQRWKDQASRAARSIWA
jgi:hypothetical protein